MVVGPVIHVPGILSTNHTWFVLERGRKQNKEGRSNSVTQGFEGQAEHRFDPVGTKASGHAGLCGEQRKQ